MADFSLSAQPIEVAPLRAALLAHGAGAYASFEGWVRDHNEGRAVRGRAYEAFGALG